MPANTPSDKALALALWPARSSNVARFATLAVLGSVLLAISAKLQVPFWPVPMTMTTFAVLAIAAAFGSRLGVAAVLLHIAEGMLGLPVFAGLSAGPAYLVGPTAGFIWGYVPAAFIVGIAADRGLSRSVPAMAATMLLGDAMIFGLGFAWLSSLAILPNGAVGIGAAKAFQAGVAPFLLGDALKIAIAALALPAGWSLLERFRK